MSSKQDEILGRLQKTIENWTGEVTSAHDTLTHQIGEASEELHTLVRIIAARNQNGSALTTALEEVGALNKIIAERDQALSDITEYNSGLELEIKKLQDAVNELTAQVEQQPEAPTEDTATQPDDQEEVVSLRETVSALESEIETLKAEAVEVALPDAASEEEIGSLRGTVSALESEIEALKAEAVEVAPPDTGSEEEIGSLRGTVSALESENEALKAEAAAAPPESPADAGTPPDPDTICALEEALEVLRAQLESAKQETETVRGELAATRIDLQDKGLGIQVRLDEAETLRDQVKHGTEAERELQNQITELHTQLQEGATALEDERTRAAEEHAVASEDSANYIRFLEENATLKQQIGEKESDLQASQNELAELRQQFDAAGESQEAVADALKEKSVVGEEQLQQTLNELDALRLQADDQNTDLQSQLDATQTELGDKVLGIQVRTQESATLRAQLDQAVETEKSLQEQLEAARGESDTRQADLSGLQEREKATEGRLEQALTELITLHEQAKESGDTVRSLTAQLDTIRTEADQNSSGLQRAQDELEALREESAKVSDAEQKRAEELESLREAMHEKETALQEAHSAMDSAQSLTIELDTLRSEADKSASELQQAHNELEALREESAKASDTEQQRAEELETLRIAMHEKETALQEAHSARDTVQSLTVELDTLRFEANKSASELQQAQDELVALREGSADLSEAEQKRAEELETLRETLREKEAALQEAGDTIESLQSEIQARPAVDDSEIDALKQPFQEQSSALDQTNTELQIQSKLVEELKENEERRAAELGISEEHESGNNVEAVETQARIEVLESELDARSRERDALALELKSIESRHEEQIKEMQREFEWFREAEGLDVGAKSKASPETAHLQERALKADLLEKETAELKNTVCDLETELAQLKSTGASDGPLPQQISPSHPIRANATPDQLEEYRIELLTFEAYINEKEKRLEIAKRNANLAEADLTANAEGQNAPKALKTAKKAISGLKDKIAERDKMIEEQKKRIVEQDHALEKFQDDLQAIMIQAQTPGGVGEGDLTALLDDIRDQNEALKDALAQRDLELDSLQNGEKTPEQLLAEQGRRISQAAYDENGARRPMGQILVNAGIITEQQLESALEQQKSDTHRRMGGILVENGFIREEIIAQVLASQLRLPFVQLKQEEIQPKAIGLLNGKLATHHMCIPIRVASGEITIAMSNPLDLIAIEDLELSTDLLVKPVVATLADITAAIVRYYGVNTSAFEQDRH